MAPDTVLETQALSAISKGEKVSLDSRGAKLKHKQASCDASIL